MDNKTNGQLKKICDIQTRRYLLSKASRNGKGQVYCPLKRVWYDDRRIHVCHFVDRAIMNCRYDRDNVHLLSAQSNTHDSSIPAEGYKSLHHKEYEEWLIGNIGKERYDILLDKSKRLTIFTKEMYLEVLERYKI